MAGVHWRSVGVRHCMCQHAYFLSIVDHTNGGHYCLPLAHPSPLLYCVLQLINRRLASYLVTQLLDLEKIFILSNPRQQPVAESHPLLSLICICSFWLFGSTGARVCRTADKRSITKLHTSAWPRVYLSRTSLLSVSGPSWIICYFNAHSFRWLGL